MLQFIKQIFASVIGTIIGITLFFSIGISSLVILLIAGNTKDYKPIVKDKSVLVFDLSTQIKDTKPSSTLAVALSGEENNTLTLRQVLKALDKASKDEKIKAIFLQGKSVPVTTGYSNLQEVRVALKKFQATGKKIIAYDLDWSEPEYYLASVADRLFINPLGGMQINGFSSPQMFLTGALAKYGIGVQIVRVGDYKGAVEPFIRKNYSPENRQQTATLLNDIWGNFRKEVAEKRGINANRLQNFIDRQGFFLAEDAQELGLVDEIAYFDQVVADLQKITGNSLNGNSFNQVKLSDYLNVNLKDESSKKSARKIAVVYAEGTIVNGEGNIDQIGSDRFAKELRKLRENEQIKAVVLRINSPGGSATASDLILRELQLTRREKPVIISMGNVAASGGYWLATGSDYIFAQDTTITGSIGVYGLLLNIEKIASNNGINWDVVKTGRFADINSATRAKTPEELALYQKSVNQIYQIFLEKVAKSRKLSLDKVKEIAQGKIWSGKTAKKIGLVDQIGGLEAAIEYAAQTANLGNDWQVKEYPQQRSFEEEIIQRLLKSETIKHTLDPLTTQFNKFKQDLRILQSLNDPRDIYTILPFNFRID